MQPTGTAVVTGASRGIGRAVSLELARVGFEVVATMRNPADGDPLMAEASGVLSVQELDVTRPDTVDLPDEMSVLVNNAAVDVAYEAVEESSSDRWRTMVDTNILGTVEVTRRAIPALRAAGGGVICSITSASLLTPVPFYGAYRATKAAVSALGETLRSELSPFGIRVLEVLPGPVDTDMLAISDRPPDLAGDSPYAEAASHYTALRRASAGDPVSTREAARRIVASILDDAAPLRVACDPMGEAMLEAWRSQPDEEPMRAMVEVFTPGSGAVDIWQEKR